ncbi:SMP-30/gluconolactonase/LRE family protein [Leifsonia shinshuensis]|uniref:SMP-30/gluconolactonase/LRE family protein n=1 Tax=Leifsonia shinshuensis TaxID=150026 RepID=UPI001F5151A8|nr:SMP-30/gluconolactonase/LRE family protein [Leifsonia shinshuensis]MCI0157727.1 SMP-30/gluconolactonase/LRE family protein [Leifsonia shinshuensis]
MSDGAPRSARHGIPLIAGAEVATDESYLLAEGPVWDGTRSRLLWVDILKGTVLTGRLVDDGRIEVLERFQMPDVAASVAIAEDGRMVIAGTDRLYIRATDGRVTRGARAVAGAGRRFNDGGPDPRGRFVAGTTGPGGRELLLRFEEDGSVTTLDDDLTLSNGLGWSPDGRQFYSVDSLARRVNVRDYEPASGATGPRSVFLTLDDGLPDGLAVDAVGCIWIAVWGAGHVLRCSPDGRIVGRVDVPAPHVSSVAFAGADLATLVITTAREGLGEEQLRAHPLSGRLFTVRPGVQGLPVAPWSVPIDRPTPVIRP